MHLKVGKVQKRKNSNDEANKQKPIRITSAETAADSDKKS